MRRSSTHFLNQRHVHFQAGFSLIELMVVISILGIIMTIANGSWSAVKDKDQVRANAEKIRGVMTSARLKAVSVGQTQYVGIDLYSEAVASTADGVSVYDKVADTWTASTIWLPMQGVSLIHSNSNGSVKAGANTGINMYSFDSRGTAGTDGSVLVKSISGPAAIGKILVVNGVTGRVRVDDCTANCQ